MQADDACVGCHACFNVCPVGCIEMTADKEGFLYPSVDETSCTSCGRCVSVCPVLDVPGSQPVPHAYACRSTHEATREASSSGGVFTLLAEHVLAGGGVIVGAAFDDDFSVLHRSVGDTADLAQLRGSKYVQSAIRSTYREIQQHLRAGRTVLFSGTPCQVAGLRTFLGRDYDSLVCIDLVCHGVPSPRVWGEYVAYRESKVGASLRGVSFRDKRTGWRRFSMSMQFDGGARYLRALDADPYMRAFLADMCLRPSCYACLFRGARRQGDITLADFWGIETIVPDMDDDKGTSLVLVGSNVGTKLFERVRKGLEWQTVDLDRALALNRAALISPSRPHARGAFLAALGSMPFDRLVRKFCLGKGLHRVRDLLGRLARRVVRGVHREACRP